MPYRSLLLMLLIIVSIGNARARHRADSFRVHFNTDEHTLDQDDEKNLDALIAAALNAAYYEIVIAAHTDSDAGNQYNMALSGRRAASVKTYLVAHAIKPKVIESRYYGEEKPESANDHTAGKAVNRRVEITLHTYEFNSAGDVLSAASPDYRQEFTIEPHRENTIKGRHGTTVHIPADAMHTKSGKPVTGKVNIVLQEFLKPCDASFNQLSTVSNGRMLESGGMFTIQAYANGEELELNKDAKMDVTMPTINMRNNMQLFTAVKNASGITEWQVTNVPFRPNVDLSPSIGFTRLNTKQLEALKVPCAYPQGLAEFSYQLPAFPKAPGKIGKAPTYKELSYKNVFTWWQRVFYSQERLQKEFNAAAERHNKSYHRRLAAYTRKKSRFDEAQAKYINDSARFENQELGAFRDWLNAQEKLHEMYVNYNEKLQWNMALQTLISKSNNNALTQANLKEAFMSSIGIYNAYYMQAYKHQYALQLIYELKEKSMYEALAGYADKGALSLDYKHQKRNRFIRDANDPTFAQLQLNENPELISMLDIARKDLIKKQISARAFDESKVGNVYATSLRSFGSFNCDRFYDTPPERMATITVPFTGEARVAFFVPEFNSYLYATRSDFGYTASMPKGTLVKVIFVSWNKEEGPLVQVSPVTFTKDLVLPLKPKAVTLKEMQKQLAAI